MTLKEEEILNCLPLCHQVFVTLIMSVFVQRVRSSCGAHAEQVLLSIKQKSDKPNAF